MHTIYSKMHMWMKLWYLENPHVFLWENPQNNFEFQFSVRGKMMAVVTYNPLTNCIQLHLIEPLLLDNRTRIIVHQIWRKKITQQITIWGQRYKYGVDNSNNSIYIVGVWKMYGSKIQDQYHIHVLYFYSVTLAVKFFTHGIT